LLLLSLAWHEVLFLRAIPLASVDVLMQGKLSRRLPPRVSKRLQFVVNHPFSKQLFRDAREKFIWVALA